MIFHKKVQRILVVIMSLSMSALAAGADSEQKEVDALYKSVITMMNQISELEARVARLERRSAEPFAPATAAAPKPNASSKAWLIRSNWSKLRVGMSEARVKQILGPPARRDVSITGRVTLKYSGINAKGIHLTGNVELNDEDQIAYKHFIKPPAFE